MNFKKLWDRILIPSGRSINVVECWQDESTIDMFLEIGMIHRLTTEHALLIHAACFQKGVGKLFHCMLFSLVAGGNLKLLLPTTSWKLVVTPMDFKEEWVMYLHFDMLW